MNAAAGAVPPQQFAGQGQDSSSRQGEQRKDMGDYRPIYTNSYETAYDPYLTQPRLRKPESNSNGSNRSRQSQRNSVHGTTRGRLDDDRLARAERLPGEMHSERRKRTRERRGRSSRSSHDSDDSPHDRRRREHRSRSRRRERDKESSHSSDKQQQEHGREQPEEEKKTGLAKLDQYITPFNVGVLLGCFDLIGGGLSLYMTNKRFGKKAQAAQAAQNGGGGKPAGGQNGGGGGGGKKADPKKDGDSNGSSSRSSGRSRGRGRSERGSRRGSLSSSEDSYDDFDDRSTRDRDRRREPQRLEYDRGGGRALPRSGRWAYHPAGRQH